MPSSHCYRCGREITDSRHARRRVKTGELERRRFAKPASRTFEIRYGQRVVCRWCARSIDIEQRRLELHGWIELGIALAALFGVILYLALR